MNGTEVSEPFEDWKPNMKGNGHMATTEELRDSPPETLIGYIVGRHHARVRKVMPSILANAEKAAKTDGVLHPDLETLAERVACLMVDMTFHMQREETIVFPYIGALAAATKTNRPPPHSPIASFEALIAEIERGHDALLEAMEEIRELTSGYKAPGDAGAVCRTWLKELEAFERELNLHLGIETDMLFPKARALALPSARTETVVGR